MTSPRSEAGSSDAEHSQISSTLLRGLAVLEKVASADARGVGVTELGLQKSTASRVLATLRVAGFVRQDTRRRYHLTSKLATLAAGYSRSLDLTTVAKPVLARLHAKYDEEIHLAVITGGEMVFVEYIPSSQPVRSNLPIMPQPVHRLAIGIAVLARLNHEQRADVVQQSVRASREPFSQADRRRLARRVSVAKERGWADFDAQDDVTKIAAAFNDATGQPMGGLCLSGPSYRMAKIAESAADDVRAAASEISRALA